MTDQISFRISGLTKLDRLELQETPTVTFEEVTLPMNVHGDVITYVALFGMPALSAIAAYLLRKHDGESFEEVVEEIRPDGTIYKRSIRYSRDATEAPDASIIRQIQGS